MRRREAFICRLFIISVFSCLFIGVNGQEVENEYQLRTEVKLSYNPLDKVQISFAPEIRWGQQTTVDRFHVETGVKYKPIKLISLAAYYRYISNPRAGETTEILHRYAFDAVFKKDIQRFKPSIRLRYTNYTEENSTSDFLRLKAKVKYNIRDCKLSPFASAEGFRDLTEAEYYKVRYAIGGEYKINKKHSINAAYKLDYYLQEYTNKHIFQLGYKFSF